MNLIEQGSKSIKQEKSQNSRKGDWICVNCNNLNYSFRNTCNRCQSITKVQNEIFKQMIIEGYNQYNYQQGFQNYLYIENIKVQEELQNQKDEQPDDEYENIYKLLVQDEDHKDNKQMQMKKLQVLNQRMTNNNNYNFFQIDNSQKVNLLMNEILLSKKDWICSNCKNLNYSFRLKCNRCKHEFQQ